MFEEVTNNLFAFYSSNAGSNAFLLIGKKLALVDASLEQNSSLLLDSMNSLGIKAKDIDLLLFTHGHADHFSGCKPFIKAEKWMHKSDADYVNIKDSIFTLSRTFETSHFPKIGRFIKPGQKFDLGPFSLEVAAAPGHTAGSVCLFDKCNGLLFSGDTLFNGAVGRFDLPSGSRKDLVESLNKIKNLPFQTLLPGHGVILKKSQQRNIDVNLKMLSGELI